MNNECCSAGLRGKIEDNLKDLKEMKRKSMEDNQEMYLYLS